MIKVMTRRFFTVAFLFFCIQKAFCEGSSFSTDSFSPLRIPKDFKKEHYLQQKFDDTLPSFSPPEIMDRFIVKEAKNRPYNHLGGFHVRLKELAKPSCTAFFFSSSNQFREKYFFDLALRGVVEVSESKLLPLSYDSNFMLRYKEDDLVYFSLKKEKEEPHYLSNFVTRFYLPFFSECIFVAKEKSFSVQKKDKKIPSSFVSSFTLGINKKRFFNRRFFASSYDEYFSFLFNIEGVNKRDDCSLSQLIFHDEFFFSFKPEYVIETSTNFKIRGKVNFILSRYKSGKDKCPAWKIPSVYPGIDIEYKKKEKLIIFFRTNNGCSFYDSFYYFYNSLNEKVCATEGLSYDRLNMEAGLNRIYNSNFKYSLSLPIHWKQNVERGIFDFDDLEKRVKVEEEFVFFISPFFSFDLSLCRRKIVIFFKNSMNIRIPSEKKTLSKYLPFNDLSFKMTCRFRTNHTIFFSLQCRTFFTPSEMGKHIFSLAFEYNYYLSESLLFFIRVNNIERFLFDELLIKKFKKIFKPLYFAQEEDIFNQEREGFCVDIGIKIPM